MIYPIHIKTKEDYPNYYYEDKHITAQEYAVQP